jgi:hypothetical protein
MFSWNKFNHYFHFRDQHSGWYLESLERLVIVHHDPTMPNRTSMTLPSKKTIKNLNEAQPIKTLPRPEKLLKNSLSYSKNVPKTQSYSKPSSKSYNQTTTQKTERSNLKSATWTKTKLNDFEKAKSKPRSQDDSKLKQNKTEFQKKDIHYDTMKRSNVQTSKNNHSTSSQTKALGKVSKSSFELKQKPSLRDNKSKSDFERKQKTDFQPNANDLHAPLNRNVEEKKSKTDFLVNPQTHLLANPKANFKEDPSDHNLNQQKDASKGDKKSNAIQDPIQELLHSPQTKSIEKVKEIIHPSESHCVSENDRNNEDCEKIKIAAAAKENSNNLQYLKLDDNPIHEVAPLKTIQDETLLKQQTKGQKQSNTTSKSTTSENLTKAWVYNEGLLGNGEKWTGRRQYPFDRRDVTQRTNDVIGRRNRRRDDGVRYWTFKNQNNKMDKAMDIWTCLFCCCS